MKYTHSWHVLQVGWVKRSPNQINYLSGRPPGLAQIAIRELLKGPALSLAALPSQSLPNSPLVIPRLSL